MEGTRNHKMTQYLEQKRVTILELGYGYVRFRSRAKKSMITIKKQLSLFYL